MTDSTTASCIHFSLVSHTNVGKTTLARTLLMQDVGTVADQAHVTLTVDAYVLAQAADGSRLILWDTPGFGNSMALAQRLHGRSNPVGWFTSQIWDRLTDKSFWLDQQIMLHVRDISSVVLYLVNLSESPQDTPYIQAEMEILSWLGKPVIVLLNQMGSPLEGDHEKKEITAWSEALKTYPFVHSILPMDAFARCWVLEKALFSSIGRLLSTSQQKIYAPLEKQWWDKRLTEYRASIAAMAKHLSKAATEQVTLASPSLGQKLLHTAQRWGLFANRKDSLTTAQTELLTNSVAHFRLLTQTLLNCNGLQGEAAEKSILRRMQTDWSLAVHTVDSQSAAAIGTGIGMAAGMALDIVSAGLSFGMGTLLGSALGAAGGAGAAQAYNMTQKTSGAVLSWGNKAIANFLVEDILLYLAIAHFGRGRGNWRESESPANWKALALTTAQAEKIDFSSWRKLPYEQEIQVMEKHMDNIMRRIFISLYGDNGRL